MQTADWALVISILSAMISLASLGWNIWSKFIYPKPDLRVHFSMRGFVGDGRPLHDQFLSLSISNHGPIACIITHAIVTVFKSPGRKLTHALIKPIKNIENSIEETDGPFTNLPKKVEVGEVFTLHFWGGERSFIGEEVDRVGVIDSFDRHHWCKRQQVRRAQREFFKLRDAGELPRLSER